MLNVKRILILLLQSPKVGLTASKRRCFIFQLTSVCYNVVRLRESFSRRVKFLTLSTSKLILLSMDSYAPDMHMYLSIFSAHSASQIPRAAFYFLQCVCTTLLSVLDFYCVNKLSQTQWLKQHKCIILPILEIRHLTQVSLRQNKGVGRAASLSGESKRKFIYLPFPASGGCPHSLFAFLFYFQGQQWQIESISHHITLTSTSTSLFHL